MLGIGPDAQPPALMPTPRSTVKRVGGSAVLYHFHGEAAKANGSSPSLKSTLPLLIVPSMINRWYVVDLREGASLVQGLIDGGVDAYCLDWGAPEDEDRYLDWDEVIKRIDRAVKAVCRDSGHKQVGILGYCMGATVSSIYTALNPSSVAAFVNLAGPIDFSFAGVLGEFVDPRWFDAAAISAAGNVASDQMQSGFSALRPTLEFAKWVRKADTMHDPAAREAGRALETWAADNVAFPGAAYRTYIEELYQQNRLVHGGHRVMGPEVKLAAIECPILTICATRDTICPPAAATALAGLTQTTDASVLEVPGGHVGAVVGSRAAASMYPAAASWLLERLSISTSKESYLET